MTIDYTLTHLFFNDLGEKSFKGLGFNESYVLAIYRGREAGYRHPVISISLNDLGDCYIHLLDEWWLHTLLDTFVENDDYFWASMMRDELARRHVQTIKIH